MFSRVHRRTTVGIVIVVSMIAFETLATATALPRAVASLHGLPYFAWAVTALLICNVIGVVCSGELCDRAGVALPVIAGIAAFGSGLVVAGVAPSMALFVLGRAIQGFGGGLVIVAIYVLIGRVYEPKLQASMFAVEAASWVVPSLIGPVIAGTLTQYVSWRAVLLIVVPFSALSIIMLWPELRRARFDRAWTGFRWWAVAAAVGAAGGSAGLQYAVQNIGWLSLIWAGIGLLLLGLSMPRLLPQGTFRGRRGLPTVVICRGLLNGSYAGIATFVPLMLTRLHGFTPTEAGAPLTLGALGWAGASWVMGRVRRGRTVMLMVGFGGLAASALGIAALTYAGAPGWAVYAVWPVGAAGVGTVYPVLSTLLIGRSTQSELGRNSSSLTISETMSASLTVAIGGAFVAASERGVLTLGDAFRVSNVAMAAVAVVGLALVSRVSETQ